MKIHTIKFCLALFAIVFTQLALAKTDQETIIKAMNDELQRNMNELQYEDYEKPFFISYVVSDIYYISANAKLGALINSSERNRKGNSARLMVGDYDLNDENWNDNTTRVYHNDGYMPFPKEDDYLAIRRSLWMMTNNIYKTAAEKYKNKKTAMDQKGMTKKDMIAPDFSKSKVKEVIESPLPNEITKTELETRIKNISNVFTDFPDVVDSNVKIEYQNLMRYFINSEGSKLFTPFRFYNISIDATVLSKENFRVSETLRYYSKSLFDLPNESDMIADAQALISNLQAKAKAEQFQGSYLGPVLFTDQAITEMHLNKLFVKGEGLMAKRRALIKKDDGISNAKYNTWEEKKNKKVIDSKLTMYSKPNVKTFENINLLGSFSIDQDVVTPPDSLMLIANGKLINQFNNRTPTPTQQSSNGHNRFYVRGTNTISKVGPDVIFVESDETKTAREIDARIAEIAGEEGLDYVFEITSLKTKASNSPLNFFKVNLETGERTLLRSVNFGGSGKELLRVESVSNEMQVVNTLIPDIVEFEARMKQYANYPPEILDMLNISKNLPAEGTPTSIICPKSLLFDQIELSGISKVINAEKPVVPYHLASE